MVRSIFVGLLLFAVGLGVAEAIRAASPKVAATTITIDGEMCGNCLKKLKLEIAVVSGVATVDGDVEKKTVTVQSKPRTSVSPKALWEAVEKAGKKPAKLTGPSGSFTSKPKI
jgi:Cu+-exporting ATPase